MQVSRLTANDIPASKRFDIDGLYDVEHNLLVELLKHEARHELQNPRMTLEQARSRSAPVVSSILDSFATEDREVDRHLLAAGRAGRLRTSAPSRQTDWTLRGLSYLTLSAEVVLGLGFFYFSVPRNPLPVVVAVALVVACYLAADGAGAIFHFFRPFLPADVQSHPQRPSLLGQAAKMLAGIAVISALTWFRAHDELAEDAMETAVLTGGLASVAWLASAVALYEHRKRVYILEHMFLCQKWNATERHRADFNRLQSKYGIELERLWRASRGE